MKDLPSVTTNSCEMHEGGISHVEHSQKRPRARYDGAKRQRRSHVLTAVDTPGQLSALHVTPVSPGHTTRCLFFYPRCLARCHGAAAKQQDRADRSTTVLYRHPQSRSLLQRCERTHCPVSLIPSGQSVTFVSFSHPCPALLLSSKTFSLCIATEVPNEHSLQQATRYQKVSSSCKSGICRPQASAKQASGNLTPRD
jgi:hypothetical protein